MPLADDPRSLSFVKDMKDWSSLTHNIYMWDYVVQFENFLCPFPNFHTLQPNVQFFSDHGVDMLFEQGTNHQWSDMKELKFYLLSHLLWNKDADTDSLTNRFFTVYYGKSCIPIRKYFDLIHERMKLNAHEKSLNIYGFPVDYSTSFLSAKHVKEYRNLMDSAEYLAGNDSVLLRRIWRARIPVDFAFFDLALSLGDPELTFLQKMGNEKFLDKEMLAGVDRMLEIAALSDVTYVNEKSLTLADYKAYLLLNLAKMSEPNKAAGSKVTLLTQSSDKYPVGGAAALTDGLTGGLHFQYNWLGFEGEDFKVVIEFPEENIISEVKINFLKALVSWVFLPNSVMIEVSTDGKNYRNISELKGDVENRNYKVESVPFKFTFSPVSSRFVQITAKSLKYCPDWHRGAGSPCWIFTDEVLIQ
jgi:hypothetical protein